MEFLAVIPARGGSKRIPRKNTREIAGKPLIAWTIEAALASASLGRVVVSTEDEEIAHISRNFGAEVLMRPTELAGDTTPTLPVLQHVVTCLLETEHYRPEAVVTLQPTSPLRTACHIDEAAAMFAFDPRADSLISCFVLPPHLSPAKVMVPNGDGYVTRMVETGSSDQIYYARNSAIYITKADRLADFILGGKTLAYLMPMNVSIDIDTMDQVGVAEAQIKTRARLPASGAE